MNTPELLCELEGHGVTLSRDGDDLVFTPAAACEDLLPALKENKTALFWSLHWRAVRSLRRVRSAVLGEDLYVAPDDVDTPCDDIRRHWIWRGLAVYQRSDMALLHGLDSQALRLRHTIYKDWGIIARENGVFVAIHAQLSTGGWYSAKELCDDLKPWFPPKRIYPALEFLSGGGRLDTWIPGRSVRYRLRRWDSPRPTSLPAPAGNQTFTGTDYEAA